VTALSVQLDGTQTNQRTYGMGRAGREWSKVCQYPCVPDDPIYADIETERIVIGY
jgi:hypothetical protein